MDADGKLQYIQKIRHRNKFEVRHQNRAGNLIGEINSKIEIRSETIELVDKEI